MVNAAISTDSDDQPDDAPQQHARGHDRTAALRHLVGLQGRQHVERDRERPVQHEQAHDRGARRGTGDEDQQRGAERVRNSTARARPSAPLPIARCPSPGKISDRVSACADRPQADARPGGGAPRTTCRRRRRRRARPVSCRTWGRPDGRAGLRPPRRSAATPATGEGAGGDVRLDTQGREALAAPVGVGRHEGMAVRDSGAPRHDAHDPRVPPVRRPGNDARSRRRPRAATPPGARRSPATRDRARRAPRPAAPIAPRAGGVGEQAGDRVGDPSDVGPSTSMPVSPSTRASRAPPESPTTTGRPHAAASMNTLPQPSTSRPPEAVAAGHREHVAGRVVAGQVLLGDLAGEHDRPGRRLGGQPFQRGQVGPAADDQQDRLGYPARGSSASPGSTRPAPCGRRAGSRRRRAGRSPTPWRSRRSAVGRSGRNISRSAPGYSTETGTCARHRRADPCAR